MIYNRFFASVITMFMLSGCVTNSGGFGSFSKGDLNKKSYGHTEVPDPTGFAPTKMVHRFEVRDGDCGVSSKGSSDCNRGSERAEMKENSPSHYGESWYGWSIYFPKDYVSLIHSGVTVAQFKPYSRKPLLTFGDHFETLVVNRYEGVPNAVRQQKSLERYELIATEDLRGKWHKIEMNIKWSSDDDGFYKIWVNGKLKVDYKGVTKAGRPYLKYGIYRNNLHKYKFHAGVKIIPTQILMYSNVKKSDTREGLLPTVE